MSDSTPLVRLRARISHFPEYKTACAYSPNGKYFITVGGGPYIRRFEVGSDEEPVNTDHKGEGKTAIAVRGQKVVTGSEDGTVDMYQLELAPGQKEMQLTSLLTRTTLPVRDVSLSPDAQWVAVASDELTLKIVATYDNQKIVTIEDLPKPPKHVSFDKSGSYLAVSCTNGSLRIYSFTTEQPTLIKEISDLISPLESESEVCSKVAWHPYGNAFAVATATRDIAIVSVSMWKKQRVFASGHLGAITDYAWSPNGALLASAGQDSKIVLWETRTQTIISKYDYKNVVSLAWHPRNNEISFTTNQGHVYTPLTNAVPDSHAELLKKKTESPPLLDDSGNDLLVPTRRGQSVDSLDGLLNDGGAMDEDDDFIVDDDGGGYSEPKVNGYGKRGFEHLGISDIPSAKRMAGGALWRPEIHHAFQPSSTPWRGNRRYLCVNLVGIVWTVDQDTHHTVTVEFYDREQFRDYHFTDQLLYDKACLNENGTLYSNNPRNDAPATIFYRPHETWAGRGDWRISLPEGEDVAALAMSESYIVVCTTNGYVRIYTLFGTPLRVYRQRHAPVVTCTAWRDYVFIVGNGPVGAHGSTQLCYTIENIRREETIQTNDVIPLPQGIKLKNIFFSDVGDPCVYDTSGVLLVLLHWRTSHQAKWVPLLDTRHLDRQLSGRVEESYWPVAVAQDKFHCIILKGTDQHPYFPRPLVSEFDFRMPVHGAQQRKTGGEAANALDQQALEEEFVREAVLVGLKEDLNTHTSSTAETRMDLAKHENAFDKALVQLLVLACKEEDAGERALEICSLFRQKRSWDIAVKVAVKYERMVLAEKIAERRDEMEVDE